MWAGRAGQTLRLRRLRVGALLLRVGALLLLRRVMLSEALLLPSLVRIPYGLRTHSVRLKAS